MIGKLDQEVTFQEASTAADGGGGLVETWGDIATDPTVWADVFPGSGRERVEDGAHNAAGLWVFVIRNRTDLSELNRIVWQSVPYNIRNVKRVGGREMYLKIEAERGVAQ